MEEVDFNGIDEFKVTRIHGMNALNNLSTAHQEFLKWKKINNELSNLTKREFINSAGKASLKSSLEESLFSLLSSSIILYQASMEAILSNVISMNDKVSNAVNSLERFSFKKGWVEALKAVNASEKEFIKYADRFYKELRIPLTHLHPKTEKRLKKINSITFKKTYTGFRYGWWAHTRLLEGVGLANSNYSANWEKICGGVRLDPDLYPESHPDNI